QIGWLGQNGISIDPLKRKIEALETVKAFSATFSGSGPMPDYEVKRIHETRIQPVAVSLAEILRVMPSGHGEEERLYIPVLRGLRPLSSGDVSSYETRTRSDYDLGDKKFGMFTGLDMYEQLQSLLLGERVDRRAVREYEEFLSSKFF